METPLFNRYTLVNFWDLTCSQACRVCVLVCVRVASLPFIPLAVSVCNFSWSSLR